MWYRSTSETERNSTKTAPYPPHFSPRASKADFNLSSPREANSYSIKQNTVRDKLFNTYNMDKAHFSLLMKKKPWWTVFKKGLSTVNPSSQENEECDKSNQVFQVTSPSERNYIISTIKVLPRKHRDENTTLKLHKSPKWLHFHLLKMWQ